MKELRFFTVCPFHTASFGMGESIAPSEYVAAVRAQAAWADHNGMYGMVIYNFHSSLDPWLTAAEILRSTAQLRPMVAVQPFHSHPYTVARQIATACYMHGRGIDLNVVVGATPSEVAMLGDTALGPDKHGRLREFCEIIRSLLVGEASCDGEFYRVSALSLSPPIPAEANVSLYVPGSSEQSAATVKAVADSSLLMAKPLERLREELARLDRPGLRQAMIVGIVARETEAAAWEAARRMYGDNRKSRLASRMFVTRSDSGQHMSNLQLAQEADVYDDILWYGAPKTGIDAPKLVGSYEQVRNALERYIAAGITDIVLDLPEEPGDEYEHMLEAVRPLMNKAAALIARA
ncbi:LLM class flavin-dependent oxidoreductase [Paenibacillus athensensis]|nr:LLM class flavin-dependent oxidoreductase [Paenibacillus athensensis]MCD1257286.1 LLM class flavin-dependent oxidoreductase [Paenibacillus athensensis]